MGGGNTTRTCGVCDANVDSKKWEKHMENHQGELEAMTFSSDMAQAVRTACVLCGNVFQIPRMRSHVSAKHNVSIMDYKKQQLGGRPYAYVERVLHRCRLCGEALLLDSDTIATHLRGRHRGEVTHREYNARHMARGTTGQAEHLKEVVEPIVKEPTVDETKKEVSLEEKMDEDFALSEDEEEEEAERKLKREIRALEEEDDEQKLEREIKELEAQLKLSSVVKVLTKPSSSEETVEARDEEGPAQKTNTELLPSAAASGKSSIDDFLNSLQMKKSVNKDEFTVNHEQDKTKDKEGDNGKVADDTKSKDLAPVPKKARKRGPKPRQICKPKLEPKPTPNEITPEPSRSLPASETTPDSQETSVAASSARPRHTCSECGVEVRSRAGLLLHSRTEHYDLFLTQLAWEFFPGPGWCRRCREQEQGQGQLSVAMQLIHIGTQHLAFTRLLKEGGKGAAVEEGRDLEHYREISSEQQ